MTKHQLFINGETVGSTDGRTETISSPATERAIAEVPVGGTEDVERAVGAARAAFPQLEPDNPR